MASSAAIGHASQSLQLLLNSTFANAGPFVGTTVDLRSPREIGTPAGGINLISLWLYRVRRFDELENAPSRISSDGRLIPAPLPLVLHYLLTPISSDEVTSQRLLGHAMQTLSAHSKLGPEFTHADLAGEADEPLGIHLDHLGFEDIAKIWQSLNEPYRLSTSYLVQYVPIESSRSTEAGTPVLDRTSRYNQVLEVQ